MADVKNENAKHLAVPQYISLSTEQLLLYASQKPGMTDFLPDQKEWRRLPRQWVINLLYTFVGEHFANWVRD